MIQNMQTAKVYNQAGAGLFARPSLRHPAQAAPWSAGRRADRRAPRPTLLPLASAAADTKAVQASSAAGSGEPEYYELFLDKPIGLKFGRGNDGGVYVLRSDPRLGSTSDKVEPGDKVVNVSASFGSDVWEALNFGQVIYAIKTRSGQVYLKLQRRYGDMSPLEAEELTEEEKKFKAERAGGNYGWGTKEVQARNYAARQQADKERRELFYEALGKFRGGKVEEALIDFENVLALEPKGYLGDDFSRVTDVYRVTQYNIACCYASLNQVAAGLEALNAALLAGFEDFDKVRKDPNLAKLREDKEAFKAVIDKYDEPVINEEALNAIKNLFSFGKK